MGIKFAFQLHYKFVQLMQIDVSKERRNDSALWSTTVGFVIYPILQISSLLKFVNQLYHPGILDFTMNQAYKNAVVDIVKAPFDVTLHEPTHTIELHF